MYIKEIFKNLFKAKPSPEIQDDRDSDTGFNDEEEVFPTASQYIEQYASLAIKSKGRCGIDASLILQGICLGDIFGMLYEGWGLSADEDPDTINPFEKKGSTFTDDTVMSIAVYEATKNALQNPEWSDGAIIEEYTKTIRKWARKYPDAGYGTKFYDWAVLLIDDERYKSYGDGGAMRAGVIGALCDTYEDTVRYAVLSAMPSHSHPEGIKGAVVTAVSVWLALNGYTKDDILKYALRFYPDGYRQIEKIQIREYITPDITLKELIDMSPDTASVVSQVAVPEAIANFMHSDDFEGCLRNSLRYRCDADTVGAISGGIAAAYYKSTGFKDADVQEVLKEKLSEDIRQMVLGM